MKNLPVAEVRSKFSSLLKDVAAGEEIAITFGRRKELIAVIMPINEYKKIKARRLGTLDGKATVSFRDDWEITEEELVDL